jgi:FAD/FMN-containing dehydrogenase
VTLTAADWEALQGGIEGGVILPGSPDYELVRRPAMARFETIRPQAVVRCTTAADVSATIAFARQFGLQPAIRSGGHSVAGRSSTDGIVIDVTPMSSVSVAGDVATVGAGTRLGALYDALAEHGRTLPAGCGSSVGIAGLTLGGGIRILGRRYGLTCDRLLQAEVVLVDGRVVECGQHAEGELFWALRGAGGGNFGVVSSFVFRAVPAPAATVFHLVWPLAHAIRTVEAWQTWGTHRPRRSRRHLAADRCRRRRTATPCRRFRRRARQPGRCGGTPGRVGCPGGRGAHIRLLPAHALPGGEAVPRRARACRGSGRAR